MFIFERWLAGGEQGCRRGSALTALTAAKVWQTYTHTHALSMCLIVISIQPARCLLSLQHETIVCVCVCVCVNATEFRHMALAVSARWDISGYSAKLPLIQTHTLKGQFIPKWTFCNLITLMSFQTCDFLYSTKKKQMLKIMFMLVSSL